MPWMEKQMLMLCHIEQVKTELFTVQIQKVNWWLLLAWYSSGAGVAVWKSDDDDDNACVMEYGKAPSRTLYSRII